jgi:hypothetical protein
MSEQVSPSAPHNGECHHFSLHEANEIKRALEMGVTYRTRLEPPPADAAEAHEGRMGVDIHI